MLADIEENDDIGMVEGGDSSRFLLEAAQTFRVLSKGGRKNLDRHVPAKAGIAGAVDFAHRSRAEGGDDLV